MRRAQRPAASSQELHRRRALPRARTTGSPRMRRLGTAFERGRRAAGVARERNWIPILAAKRRCLDWHWQGHLPGEKSARLGNENVRPLLGPNQTLFTLRKFTSENTLKFTRATPMHLPWATPGSGLHETRVWGPWMPGKAHTQNPFLCAALARDRIASVLLSSPVFHPLPLHKIPSPPPPPQTFTPLRFTQTT